MGMEKIELIRGDTSDVYKFQRIDSKGNAITTKPQKMWITFKERAESKVVSFQKTLDNGISFSEEDYYYRFKIESKDTSELACGKYGFDIAIINETGEKKTLLNNGILELIEHYTHIEDEV